MQQTRPTTVRFQSRSQHDCVCVRALACISHQMSFKCVDINTHTHTSFKNHNTTRDMKKIYGLCFGSAAEIVVGMHFGFSYFERVRNKRIQQLFLVLVLINTWTHFESQAVECQCFVFVSNLMMLVFRAQIVLDSNGWLGAGCWVCVRERKGGPRKIYMYTVFRHIKRLYGSVCVIHNK